MYIIKNVTKRNISINDFLNGSPISLSPDQIVDLEEVLNRNQILFSVDLKKFVKDGWIQVVNISQPPDPSQRFLVDATLSGSSITIDNATISLDKGIPFHSNGMFLNTNPIDITPPNKTSSILISNKESNPTNSLIQVSFDDGLTYFEIERGSFLSIDTEITSFKVKGTLGANYQILLTYKP